MCCDDIHDVTPRVSALAGCDRLVSEPLVIENSLIPLSRGSFDVIVGMDWLSKKKFVIVCYEKVVEIPLEDSRKLRVQGKCTLGAAKALMNAKVDEPKVGDISVGILLMCSQKIFRDYHHNDRKEKLYAKFTKSEAVKNWEVPTTPSEI
ncbi:hypothetical protein Tco_1169091 [Tanacetum coccineum]